MTIPAILLVDLVRESTSLSREAATAVILAGRVVVNGAVIQQPELILPLPQEQSPKVEIDSKLVNFVYA